MTKFMPLLKEGYAFRIYDYQEFPFEDIYQTFRHRTHKSDIAKEMGVGGSTLYNLLQNKGLPFLSTITKFLNVCGLDLVLIKDGEIYSDNLDVNHLVKPEHRMVTAELIGLSHTYFYNEDRQSHRIDLYLRVLKHFGLELAIIGKETYAEDI